MKVSTAAFASILAVCLTVSYVSGQIVFPDSTVQSTAAGGSFVVQPGDAYHFSNITSIALGTPEEFPYGGPISDIVPSGYELVILQISSYLGSPQFYTVDQSDVATFAFLGLGSGSYTPTVSFPNGVFVIDEGHQLYGQITQSGISKIAICSVFGYYRQK
jgi:hypothetical protein